MEHRGERHKKDKRLNPGYEQHNALISEYESCHTMAMTLQRNAMPREVISQVMGHAELKTTNVYLDSFESEVVDQAVSAMKEIGNGRVTETELEIIAQALKSESVEVVELDLQLAPAWIRKTLIKP